MKRPHAERGFTLVELMIALVAGSFAVAGVYYLNGMSSRMYGEQMRVSETQMSLRSAMEQLRREFARAGYLHTVSTRVTPDCSGDFGVVGPNIDDVAPRALRAVSILSDGSLGSVNGLLAAPVTNRTRADRVDVWANFATSDAYLADPNRTTKTSIAFQTMSESFRRSFFDSNANGGLGAIDPERFRRAFTAGRMLRVEHEGRTFFRDIVSVDPATLTVTIGRLPWCFEPNGWTAVSPVVHYRYQLEPDTESDLARLRAKNPSYGSARPLLIRREWNDLENRAVANSAHVVLDYAVEFSVDAYVDTAAQLPPAAAFPPVLALVRGGNLEAQTRDDPHQLRSLIVTLSSRSAEADPNLPFIPRNRFGHASLLASPLLTFRVVEPAQPGVLLNARVRTLRSEIYLQNL